MATNRARRRPGRRLDMTRLTEGQCRHLTHGKPLLPWTGFDDFGDLQVAWQQHQRTIMAAWLERYPGYRPFAWWAFVAIPRWGERCIIPTAENRRMAELMEAAPGRGVPRCYFGIWHTHMAPRFQETEEAYLRRHGQLSGTEELKIGADSPFDGSPSLWESHLKAIYGDE